MLTEQQQQLENINKSTKIQLSYLDL